MVKDVLLTEIRELGPDAEMIVKLLDKVHPVQPVQLPRQQQANVVQCSMLLMMFKILHPDLRMEVLKKQP